MVRYVCSALVRPIREVDTREPRQGKGWSELYFRADWRANDILDNQNVFVSKFTPASIKYIGGVLVENGITSTETIAEVIGLTTESLIDRIADVPGIAGNPALFEAVVKAGQIAYAESYKYVYYSSIAFGSVSIVAALFLGDISQFMDDHVAVVM